MIFPFKKYCAFPIEHYPMNEIPEVSLGYDTNRYGYRCGEFSDRSRLNVLFLGDGWTEGLGVADDEIYPEIACRIAGQRLGVDVTNWNLGHRIKGYDYLARIIMSAVPVLKPELVFISLPSPRRREFFGLDGQMVDFGPERLQALEEAPETLSSIEKDLLGHWRVLESDYDDLSWAILNHKLCEEVLNGAGISWGYACNGEPDAVTPASRLMSDGWMDPMRKLKTDFGLSDEAAGHPGMPGPESHRVFAEAVAEWIIEISEASG